MEIEVKGIKKQVRIGDTILLKTGEMAKVTGQIDTRAIIATTDKGEVGVFAAADIVDVLVWVVRELGLIEKLIAWLKQKLTPRNS